MLAFAEDYTIQSVKGNYARRPIKEHLQRLLLSEVPMLY